MVKSRNYTVFIGVDDYDAPIYNTIFSGATVGLNDTINQIELQFKWNFFEQLKRGCDESVTNKCFLTGVTPAYRSGASPLLDAHIISEDSNLHDICGFTESEVKTIIKRCLRKDELEVDTILFEMRRLCNGYHFADFNNNIWDSIPHPLYNPALVFHYIRKFSINGFISTLQESTSIHSPHIFQWHIFQFIANFGGFSLEDLSRLMMNEPLESKLDTNFSFADLGKKNVAWSILFYLGVLARDQAGNLRIPNDVVK
ncbi:hypothetical protein BC937DRAFT_89601 [Endogone sp. FLAS-F59071]|nr:hypothetical protein BC937DRAFT_89601 [Endogone sp. FLAS-F59071]|eukprot:RUS17701.1 hypothetical protein BC937DRAFT_89601 [Endogone sp. FLAS-F59071]